MILTGFLFIQKFFQGRNTFQMDPKLLNTSLVSPKLFFIKSVFTDINSLSIIGVNQHIASENNLKYSQAIGPEAPKQQT